jgi:hypothetical protein
VWESRVLPAPLSGNAYYTGGTNRSDDLFIYSKKKFGGYAASKLYKLTFEIEIATSQSSGCVGVGGSPGESVYVVAGAAPTEPKTVLTAGQYVVNLERGNQATPGAASQVLGNVANTVANCGPQVYQSKIVKSTAPLAVKSDANGDIWVFFGIDSGFEAKRPSSTSQSRSPSNSAGSNCTTSPPSIGSWRAIRRASWPAGP